jgi:hypothetical protein
VVVAPIPGVSQPPSYRHDTTDKHAGTRVGRTGAAVLRDSGAARGYAQNEIRTTLKGRKRDYMLKTRGVHLAAGTLAPTGDNPANA